MGSEVGSGGASSEKLQALKQHFSQQDRNFNHDSDEAQGGDIDVSRNFDSTFENNDDDDVSGDIMGPLEDDGNDNSAEAFQDDRSKSESPAGSVSGPLDIVSGRKPIVGAEDVAKALSGTQAMDQAEQRVSEKHGEPVQL